MRIARRSRSAWATQQDPVLKKTVIKKQYLKTGFLKVFLVKHQESPKT